ncbi:STAS domain-containing protein [Candidatus Saccharibacteria bacterium]|nr:STAS domain-containing protein [Candidatus Saccharibacteria bacterium]
MTGESNQGGESSRGTIMTRVDGDILYAILSGEMDLYATPEIKAEIEIRLKEEHAKKLVYDFSQITFVDSVFLGSLVGTARRFREQGGRVGIVGMNNGDIRKIFSEIPELAQAFPYYLDEEVTVDRDVIIQWAEKHGAHPVLKRYSERPEEESPTIAFPGEEEEGTEVINWEYFFTLLGPKQMRYQSQAPQGIDKPFFKFEEAPEKS